MIFITLGTQDKPFNRLLKQVDKEIKNGNICEKVIVQAGCTKYETENMECFNQVSQEAFEKYMKECNLLITHAGVGSIITGLKYNKTIIAIPRLEEYGEAANNHQMQIVETFSKDGFLIGLNDLNKLSYALKRAENFKPKKFISNTKKFTKNIIDFIEG